jgi:hypothetical protein
MFLFRLNKMDDSRLCGSTFKAARLRRESRQNPARLSLIGTSGESGDGCITRERYREQAHRAGASRIPAYTGRLQRMPPTAPAMRQTSRSSV